MVSRQNDNWHLIVVGVFGTDKVEGEDPWGDWFTTSVEDPYRLYPPSHGLEKQ